MRWKNLVAGLMLGVAGLVGCKQQCFLTECDYQHYHHLGLPQNLENNPAASVTAPVTALVGAPATILDPERPIRYLSLQEAIALALEQGTVGIANAVNPGQGSDQLATAGPGTRTNVLAGNDQIRVLALDPAIAGADIEASLSKFDTRWITSLVWNKNDEPTQGLSSFQVGDGANFSTGITKPLPTGGVAGITFRTDYTLLTNPPQGFTFFNPAWRPRLQFGFEQPLLQGFGVEINQLRAQHPGIVAAGLLPNQPLQQFAPGGSTQGILLSRIAFDIQRIEFERQVAVMILNVENAYWNLYGQYWNLYSREQALRQAYEAWRINKARFEAGRSNIQDFAQTRVQYELFRGQRITALGQVLEAERQLRALLGMPVEDGTRLVPADQPTLAPYNPDWGQALQECLTLRPELVMARQDLKARQLDVILAKNSLMPDLRVIGQWDINGIGTRLDGPDNNNALRSLSSGKFTNSTIGLRLDVPLGFRGAHANLRIARLNLARSYLALQDNELKAQRFLALQYRQIFQFYELIRAQRAQRLAAAEQLQARFQEFQAGRGTLDVLLEAQRFWADALRDEYNAIVQYQNALAGWEFAKGTLLKHDNVHIAEGPLPECAQVRAVDHARERTKAFVLLERANPIVTPCDYRSGGSVLPALPADKAPTLPAVLEGHKPPPDFDWLPSHRDPGPTPLSAGPAGTDISQALPVLPTPVLPTTPALPVDKPRGTSPVSAPPAASLIKPLGQEAPRPGGASPVADKPAPPTSAPASLKLTKPAGTDQAAPGPEVAVPAPPAAPPRQEKPSESPTSLRLTKPAGSDLVLPELPPLPKPGDG